MLNMKIARIKKGLSQIELGDKIGVSNRMISQYESGYSTPGVDTLVKIADVLEVTVDYLLGREK